MFSYMLKIENMYTAYMQHLQMNYMSKLLPFIYNLNVTFLNVKVLYMLEIKQYGYFNYT